MQEAESKHKQDILKILQTFSEEHGKWEEEETTEKISETDLMEYKWKDDLKSQERKFLPLLFFDSEKKILGFALLWKFSKTEYHILELYVCPKYRKQGIGRKFIQAILETYCSEAKTIEAASHIKNAEAQKFWNAVGFKTVEQVIFNDRTIYGIGKYFRNVYSK
jgi:ribosomal protein S18 acetylase RimI-like enzyme